MDGNLIAQAPGDGSAHMVQPFIADQTPYIQMNQALLERQRTSALARKKEEDDRAAQKEAWIAEIKGNHKYDPVDRPVVEREQKRLLDLIYKYDGTAASKFAIDDAQIGLAKFINDSSSIYDQYLKKASDLSVNGDKVYFNNEDLLKSSRAGNTAPNLEEAFGVLGKRSANIDAFTQDQEKIKDIPNYLALSVTKLKPIDYATEQMPTQFGYVSTPVPKYDAADLKNLAGMLWKEKRSLRDFYKDENELYNAMLPYQAKTEKPVSKGSTSNQTNIGGGGNTVVSGKMVLSPAQDYTYTDIDAQEKSYADYRKKAKELILNEPDEKKADALYKAQLSEEDYKKAHPYSYKMQVIPLSTLGLAENTPHKFNVKINGVETEIVGQPIKYSVTKDAFIVQPDKDSPKTYLASVNKNPQYLTDYNQTIDDFRGAVEKVKTGKYAKTDNNSNFNTPAKPAKKEISRKDIPAKAAAAGYSVSEYEKLLKQNGVTIK